MTRYFGFAFSAAMLPRGHVTMNKRDVAPAEAVDLIEEGTVSCLNRSHQATIEAAHSRFGLVVEVPEKPPVVALTSGDQILILQVRGLPRLTDRHEYTKAEIDSASFTFMLISVS